MRAQYLRYIKEQVTDIARLMSFLVEQGQDAVLSESHRTSIEALTSKMEVEVSKQLSKALLAKATKKVKDVNSDADQSELFP